MQTFVLIMLLNIERSQEAPFNAFAYILIIYRFVFYPHLDAPQVVQMRQPS